MLLQPWIQDLASPDLSISSLNLSIRILKPEPLKLEPLKLGTETEEYQDALKLDPSNTLVILCDAAVVSPPLLNSSNPWATSEADLLSLYASPHTGAVTIRTSLWSAFSQHASTHQYTFFSPSLGHATSTVDTETYAEGRGEVRDGETSSLNTLGYSPNSFEEYITMLVRLHTSGKLNSPTPKPFIVSVTGTADEVGRCYAYLSKTMSENEGLELMMEVNLSCPNIPSKPPPAYDATSLSEYISAIAKYRNESSGKLLHVGIKTPPYIYHGQFRSLLDALESSTSHEGGCPISFITATNTLGSCLVLAADGTPALGSATGEGIGGLAGDALHPLALGNVKTIRAMLNASPHASIRAISIIGIGGVRDASGYKRMAGVGASAVGIGTALGREGVSIFTKIARGLEETETDGP
ncbi:putative dihydroorotate dehydrogenase A (fumarate) [Lachnellula suecica]|uniref:Dihydroorotate dehydrogenase (fumarate) n=1 Tax=Lachnellula suecica TaxID=602035 RepID=A0A8T9C8R5_9HELO|nr:putative dihydroorotate dehydrogenase A (fumarate) [Lachnellula suecica]